MAGNYIGQGINKGGSVSKVFRQPWKGSNIWNGNWVFKIGTVITKFCNLLHFVLHVKTKSHKCTFY